VLSVSERRACAALGQHRSTQRKLPQGRDDEVRLTADIVELARQYGRYGYRKIAELLRRAGWLVNDKRVERIWRREGLKDAVGVPPMVILGVPDHVDRSTVHPNSDWPLSARCEREHALRDRMVAEAREWLGLCSDRELRAKVAAELQGELQHMGGDPPLGFPNAFTMPRDELLDSSLVGPWGLNPTSRWSTPALSIRPPDAW